MPASPMSASLGSEKFVPETRFGFWFLGTETWSQHVLKIAIADLQRQMDPQTLPDHPVILDVGCGQGKSFKQLQGAFNPQRMIGIDLDDKNLEYSKQQIAAHQLNAELKKNSCSAIDLPDASVDAVFCHQTFHHLVEQEESLAEFYRVLKPGGLLLFAESTKAYIHSWVIRLLFRHPMDVQRTADEYLAMIRTQGFQFETRNVSLPYLWWSRSDLGALEFFGFKVPQQGQREETLVNVVARKPV